MSASEHEKKRLLITGAGRGIGRAIALAAAQEGYAVAAHYGRSEAAALSLKEEIEAGGGEVELLCFDVADRPKARSVLEDYVARRGAPWGVVCNAGICADNAFPALSEAAWDSVLDTNLGGFYNVLHPLVLPMCRKRRGRIVTLSSISGLMGNRGQVNYSASKAGLIGATKALALELAGRGITVNCVAPGLIETEMVKDAPLEHILPLIPMGRAGKSEEVAALVLFLLSESASYITRQVISINGGWL